MSDVLNPVQIEAAIRDCSNRIAAGVQVCSDRYADWQRAEHNYSQARARAEAAYEGPGYKMRGAVDLLTAAEDRTRIEAEVLYKHADRLAKALEAELRAWQSINKSVLDLYGAAGRAEA